MVFPSFVLAVLLRAFAWASHLLWSPSTSPRLLRRKYEVELFPCSNGPSHGETSFNTLLSVTALQPFSQSLIRDQQYGASWVDGGPDNPNQSTAAFRIPWGIQTVPGFILFVGMFFFPKSPRWLAGQDRARQAARRRRPSSPKGPCRVQGNRRHYPL